MVTIEALLASIFILAVSLVNYYGTKRLDETEFISFGIEIDEKVEKIIRERALAAALASAVPLAMICYIWSVGQAAIDVIGFLIMIMTSLIIIGVQLKKMRA